MGTCNLSSSFFFASFKFSRDGKAREEGTRYISSSFLRILRVLARSAGEAKGNASSFFLLLFCILRVLTRWACEGGGNALPLLRVLLPPNSLSSIFFRRPSTQSRRGGKGGGIYANKPCKTFGQQSGSSLQRRLTTNEV